MSNGFEWDAEKARTNQLKHRVDFALAVEIFEGPRLEVPDTREVYGEDRYISVGEVAGRCLVVVHAPRDGKTRIISARKATKHEQALYYREIYGEE
tara:strand:- start:948 stop:1235 length:288 start_codon:yes stop_codon:yes gene_type:complete